MSDRRRPDLIFHIRRPKKRTLRVELFKIQQWPKKSFRRPTRPKGKPPTVGATEKRYRIRIEGRWFRDDDGHDLAFAVYEVRDIFWRSISRLFP